MNEELWDNILHELALRTKKPMSMVDELIHTVVGVYTTIEEDILNPSTELSDLVLYNNIHNFMNDSEVNLEQLEEIIGNYLRYLVWKFPNKSVEPFLLIDSIPKEKWEFVTWFVFVTFIQVNKELGELFDGKEELDKNWLSYTLELSPYLKGQKFDINEYLNKNYYFSTISIKFT